MNWLWLDEQVETGAAGIDEYCYGKPSGVLGFRLFPNPDFNESGPQKMEGDRFHERSDYYNDNKLVRRIASVSRVGACHIAPYPDKSASRSGNPRGKTSRRHWQSVLNEGKSLRL